MEDETENTGGQRCVGIVSANPLNIRFNEYLLELSTDFDYHSGLISSSCSFTRY